MLNNGLFIQCDSVLSLATYCQLRHIISDQPIVSTHTCSDSSLLFLGNAPSVFTNRELLTNLVMLSPQVSSTATENLAQIRLRSA